jgi:hypothetical protein
VINALKTYFRNKALDDFILQHKSEKQYRSFDEITRILLVFDGTDITKYGRINNIIKNLQREGKQVTCLAYFNDKELDDICLTQHSIQFISKAEFDWKGVPHEEFMQEFVQSQYHICINLNLFNSEPVETLVKLCDAELKAGKNFSHTSVSDFVINVTDDKDETFLVEQIKYYLRSVNSIDTKANRIKK